MENVVLLGASGSIGQQTLDILRAHPDEFRLVGVSVGKRIDSLRAILNEFKTVKYACVQEENSELIKEFPQVTFFSKDEGLIKLVSIDDCTKVINSLVGFVGFLPSLKTIENNKDLILANKETLVAGGDLIKEALRHSSSNLYPIDSEHSAIWQCLHGNRREDLNRLIITASGGSFRNLKREELKNVTKNDALKHPTWSMGAKITIDSATMMNKAFEIMEAHYLFDVDYQDIDVLLHDESIIHSLIEFKDGAQLAQLGSPDMRIPIQYALTYPEHSKAYKEETLDLAKIGTLHFREMDYDRYPLVKIVKDLAPYGGNIGAVLNGANDTAVNLFLEDKISFLDIEKSIIKALKAMTFKGKPDVNDIVEAYQFGVNFVKSLYE